MSAATGIWSGTDPLAYSYRWEACNNAGGECKEIHGAVETALSLLESDVGSTIRVIVTATNSAGSTSATSPATSPIAALLPGNTSLPSITGLLQQAGQLTAASGEWSGTKPISYSYRWEACNNAGGECKEIHGAVETALSLLESDVGSTIRVIVTATNSAGSTSATSPATSPIAALLPANTSLPSITGLLEQGGLLSAAAGTWSGTEPLRVQLPVGAVQQRRRRMQRNPRRHRNRALAARKRRRIHIPRDRHRHQQRRLHLSHLARDKPNRSTAASQHQPPSITGLLEQGGLLSAAAGTWSGTQPLAFSYQWEQCNSAGGECKEIHGAIETALSLLESDVGSTFRVTVTATNSAGSTSATSPATSPIAALLPANTSLPSITGVLEEGRALTAASGEWSGTKPIGYSYQWQQCNSAGEAKSCKGIEDATAPTLNLVNGLLGSTVRVLVTASNGAGSTQAASAVSSPILAILPVNTELPVISGLLKLGSLLSTTEGKWTGTGPITYSYQWQACNALKEPSSCKNILKAVEPKFLLEVLDVGLTLRSVVTATNARGSVSADSKITGLIESLL